MFILLSCLLGVGVHALAMRALVRGTRYARHARALTIAAGLFGLVAPLGRVFVRAGVTWLSYPSAFLVLEAVALLVAVACALVVRLALRVAPGTGTGTGTGTGEIVTRRDAVVRVAGAGIYGATFTALGWGMAKSRLDFQTEEVVVRIPGLPRALEGYVIAQVSDIHVGAFIGEAELDRGFELVTRARPDLVVATGDLVDFQADAIGPLAERLARLGAKARHGAYAIVGNHDHYAGAAEVSAHLRRAGVPVLVNEAARIARGDGGGFALLGVDDLFGRRSPSEGHRGPDLGLALRGAEGVPRILLAHQPEYFREAAGRVELMLAGHTHGGQIRPLTAPATAFMEFVAGRYERAGSTLWVNRGFGTSGPPSRAFAPPEITRIVLVSA